MGNWKYITPIPKEGDPLDPNNWRPLRILPLPSKLLEKGVHYQLMNYFQNKNLLDERQHGFRKDFSTATATFKVVKDLFNSINNGDTVHFGYSGHLGLELTVHYIRMSTICEVSSICGVRVNLVGMVLIHITKGVDYTEIHIHSI